MNNKKYRQKSFNQQLTNFEKKKPGIEGDQQKVFNAIKEYGPATGQEISDRIGRRYHRISGRFGELKEKDLIEVKCFRPNDNGYSCKVWKVKG